MSSLEKESNSEDLEENLLSNDHLNNESTSEPSEKTLWSIKGPIFALVVSLQAGAFIAFSFLPYVGFMCISLVPELNEQTVGSYVGLISAVSALGKALSAYFWGRAANKYGRKAVFYGSFVCSIVFSILFGLSTSITMAFITRFFLGASNNNMLVIKTMCSELAGGDKKFEARIMAFVIGSFGWISLYGPLISGYLADPVTQFPKSWISTTYHEFFSTYPFVLPNVASSLFCVFGILSVYFFLPETQKSDSSPKRGSQSTWKSIWEQPRARDHLIAMWMFAFSGVFVSDAVVLFYLATNGGLSLQENLIGVILTVIGVIYLILQYQSFKGITGYLSNFRSMQLSSLCSIPLVILLPVSLLLNKGKPPNTLSVVAFLYIVGLQGLRRIFGSAFMSLINISLNRSVERSEVASINALGSMGSSLLQTFSPLCAGFLTSFSLSNDYFPPSVGIYLTFGVISAFGLSLFAFVSLRLKKHHVE